jgi:hypothetical protein
MPMQSSVDPTPLLGGDALSDHVISQPFHPVVEEVVVSMKYSFDSTLILESVKSTKLVMSMEYLDNPLLSWGLMSLLTMFLAFPI